MKAPATKPNGIHGLILAGGEARRLSGKPFRDLIGRPLIAHVIERAAPQVDALAISMRGDPAPFASLGLRLVADAESESAGPVAGIAAGLRWAARLGVERLVVFPCDAPFLPLDLVARLAAGRGDAAIALPSYRGRLQPAFGLWDTSLADAVDTMLQSGERRLRAIVEALGAEGVAFDGVEPDPFLNINTEEDFQEAARRIAKGIR